MKRSITSKITAEVRPLDAESSIDGSLFAINWVSIRSSWLYTLYMGLAARRVQKIGGAPVFKGQTRETLMGINSQAREILLIVHYPSGQSFLALFADKIFQLVSGLRVAAVRNLSFVLNQRLDRNAVPENQPLAGAGQGSYAALLYRSSGDPRAELAALRHTLKDSSASVEFFSYPAASIVIERAGQEGSTIPFVTDRVAILRAASVEDLSRLATLEIYNVLSGAEDLWLGRMDRSI